MTLLGKRVMDIDKENNYWTRITTRRFNDESFMSDIKGKGEDVRPYIPAEDN